MVRKLLYQTKKIVRKYFNFNQGQLTFAPEDNLKDSLV